MYKKIDQNDIDFLLTILDKEDVVVGSDINEDYAHDELAGEIKYPEVLVFVHTTEQVSKIMKYAYENNIPVIVLKGLVVREYYPQPEQRSMSDADIFVKAKDINNDMLANKDYGQDMQKLKDATENYDLEKIAKYVCDILNNIEGSDKYSIEIKSTYNTDKSNSDQNTNNKSNNTDKSNSDKNTSNKSSNTNQNTSNTTNKNTTNKNNNTNKNNDDEYQSGDYGDYTKCPQCKKMTFHPDGYCENCGYRKAGNEDGANHSSKCANCGSATINADGTCPYCGYKN